jgi:tetratricopeptide (TPR) repeat protein
VRAAILVAIFVGCTWGASAVAQEVPGCGSLTNAYGPFDYSDYGQRSKYLPVVEQYHFTPEVRMLQKGRSGTLIGDITYVLRAFPNHPAALDAMSRYVLRGGKFAPDDDIGSAECYFERAAVWAPQDPAVHVIYANYLFKRKKKDDARAHYETALKLAPESAEINYSAGLFFLDMGDLERAKQLAQVAYDRDYPLPGLKNKIAAAEQRKPKE